MSETKLVPHITISFECDLDLHTQEVIEVLKSIQEQPMFRNLITTQFHNLNMVGDMEKLINQIDPEGLLYQEYLKSESGKRVEAIEHAVRDELNHQLLNGPVYGEA